MSAVEKAPCMYDITASRGIYYYGSLRIQILFIYENILDHKLETPFNISLNK